MVIVRPSKKIILTALFFLYLLSPVCCFSSDVPCDCGYLMCEYEKGNIDDIIMEHAEKSRTVMFGEIHDSVLEGTPPPLEDSEYVASLLPRLKKIGYDYLALEVKENAKENTHSKDILRFHEDYADGRAQPHMKYSNAKPGWIELVRTASDLGYRIKFIDVREGRGYSSRDKGMFEKIRREIFDRDADARVLVFVGANHIAEYAGDESLSPQGREKMRLGLYLNRYTKGNNFSVYMGYAHDTPAGCDLFISHFI